MSEEKQAMPITDKQGTPLTDAHIREMGPVIAGTYVGSHVHPDFARKLERDQQRLDWIIRYVHEHGLVGFGQAIMDTFRATDLREFNRESIDAARAALGGGD